MKVETEKKQLRAETYEIKQVLRSEGMKVYQMPWGIAIDKGPEGDAVSEEFKVQVNAILDKFKRI